MTRFAVLALLLVTSSGLDNDGNGASIDTSSDDSLLVGLDADELGNSVSGLTIASEVEAGATEFAYGDAITCLDCTAWKVGTRITLTRTSTSSSKTIPAGSKGTIVCGGTKFQGKQIVSIAWDGRTDMNSPSGSANNVCNCPAYVADARLGITGKNNWNVLATDLDCTAAATTKSPTSAPTEAPTKAPTEAPTRAPTDAPTRMPTSAPTKHSCTYGISFQYGGKGLNGVGTDHVSVEVDVGDRLLHKQSIHPTHATKCRRGKKGTGAVSCQFLINGRLKVKARAVYTKKCAKRRVRRYHGRWRGVRRWSKVRNYGHFFKYHYGKYFGKYFGGKGKGKGKGGMKKKPAVKHLAKCRLVKVTRKCTGPVL